MQYKRKCASNDHDVLKEGSNHTNQESLESNSPGGQEMWKCQYHSLFCRLLKWVEVYPLMDPTGGRTPPLHPFSHTMMKQKVLTQASPFESAGT